MEVEIGPPPQEERADSAPLAEGDELNQEHARPRKRTRRACDKCSSSRTRCDGEFPCRRCEDYGYTCRYNREIKKRGRVPTALVNHSSVQSDSSQSGAPQSIKDQQPGPVSPSPPLRSPDAGLGHVHFVQPQARQCPAPDDEVTTQAAVVATQSVSTTTANPAPYLTSPGFTGPNQPLQLAAILDPSAEQQMSRAPQESPSHVTAVQGRINDAEVAVVSDDSIGYPSPANGISATQRPVNGHHHHHGSFGNFVPRQPDRGSFSTSTAPEGSIPEVQRVNSLYQAPSSDCRYRCLDPVLPYIRDIIPAAVACDLLDVYFTEPGSSLFRCASPYILTRIFRKKSLLRPLNPRPMTPALLATMLWCSAQTADIVLLHVPGSRAKICNSLYELATSLISDRDPDKWRRIHGGLRVESDQQQSQYSYLTTLPNITALNEPAGVIDDVLTFILLSIAVSGGDFKSDCFKWWSKAVRLALALQLHREDEHCPARMSPCVNPLCSCRREQESLTLASAELREERRRVFWLLYCLDRHLALSFNTVLCIPDSYCEIYAPLPETVWENLDSTPPKDVPPRVLGPPTTVTGTGFFEYFLPLMAILGDIIEVHHRRQHPRLGGLDDSRAVAVISDLLANCERSIEKLGRESDTGDFVSATASGPSIKDLLTGLPLQATPPGTAAPGLTRHRDRSRLQLVAAYSTHILHVLHVLLHGKWDAISMLDDDDDWITSARFNDCATHAIAASQAVSSILKSDPELTFMPYLFGIYLLHGSFILLLFADRMPQLGPNQSVEQACETIIRAHEVCVVTLSTEFQKNFRKVLRSTLYSVRGSSPTEWEEHRARRRALSLYRWTKGAKGLGL
ncbi:Transcriptional activator xlnR [Pleurostoma richardsiae]|uniref:Transcriptional activator xlnR n=1 Tax=Pleurostoma richardsiae TaxID=41990 RepID=A0AA38RR29_9PEZI|nr:Transcriptional activator xlnR [Pleurostoma richardsiae]